MKSVKSKLNLKIRGPVVIVNEELMAMVSPPEGPPVRKKEGLSFLHYFSATKIHRYSGDAERFLRVGNGLIFDGDPHVYEYDPDKNYFPADRARREEIFAKKRKQLESTGLQPVLNYVI